MASVNAICARAHGTGSTASTRQRSTTGTGGILRFGPRCALISGNGFGCDRSLRHRGCSGRRPCAPTLNTRSVRVRPTIDRNQRRMVVPARFPKPLRNARWTNIQTSHAGKPLSRMPRTLHDRAEAPDGRDTCRGRGTRSRRRA